MKSFTLLPLFCTALCFAIIHKNPGGKVLPHDKYIHRVSEAESPVHQVYIKSKDGLYVAVAIRKPAGNGPFPVLIHFHGAPGGRGIEQLAGWARGDTGGPLWERFLQEGYVVVVADYRATPGRPIGQSYPEKEVTAADDGVAVVDYVRSLPYVDPSRINVYGVSLGGNVVLHVVSRTKVHAAILGAPYPVGFLGATLPSGSPRSANPLEEYKGVQVDLERARRNIATIECPVLILAGTADALLYLDLPLHDLLEQQGKRVRMEIYENGYHDFCIGPQGHIGRDEPLLDATLDALEKSVQFLKDPR